MEILLAKYQVSCKKSIPKVISDYDKNCVAHTPNFPLDKVENPNILMEEYPGISQLLMSIPRNRLPGYNRGINP